MNCLSLYCYGTLLLALGLIEVVSAAPRFIVNSADVDGTHFGPGIIIVLKDSESGRIGYAERVEGKPAVTRAVWEPTDIKYFESSGENNSVKFECRDGKMNIINFAVVHERTAVEKELKDFGVPCRINGVITPSPRKD